MFRPIAAIIRFSSESVVVVHAHNITDWTQITTDTKDREHTHSFGPIQDTMQILQRQNKGAHLNTIERCYIYREFTKEIT